MDQTFCRECGKPIEADARFCRFCGKPQADRAATATAVPSAATRSTPVPAAAGARQKRSSTRSGDGLEERLRQLFPRHHLQDEFMHIATIAAFFMALIGFVLGFFPAYTWLADNFLLGSVALILFLILRESTLSHIRVGRGSDTGATPSGGRYQAGRPATDLPPEAATTQSSPRAAAPPPARPGSSPPRA